MMLTGGKWGEASCADCNLSLGAAIACPHCGFINAHVDSDGEALAEQKKQGPVALDEVRRIAAEYAEPNSQVDSGNLYWALCEALKYAAPVSAEAIRAEALEDAVKFLEENGMIAPNGFTAAGIRGLK